jgi:hypothetical protein
VIGFAASFLLPARPGEVLRPYLLARREGLPPTAAFATIILERLLDLVTVLLLFGVFVLVVDPASLSGDPALYGRVKSRRPAGGGGAVAGLVVFFFLAGHPERLGAWALRDRTGAAGEAGASSRGFVETFAQGSPSCGSRAAAGFAHTVVSAWLSIAAGSGSRRARFI